jgi:tRNA dimethylallyltransferase
LQLAEQYACPIISADSRQIYKDLPIGTAAPTADELARAKHYFVGNKELTDTYSAGQYARDCQQLLPELFRQHERVIMSGGSMMYIDAVCKGLDDMPDVPEQVRMRLREQYEQKGLPWLQEQVKALDPDYWDEVDQQNPQRLIHCLEICQVCERPYSSFRKKAFTNDAERGFNIEYQVVNRPRAELYDRINRRVHQMIADGLLDEARLAFEKLHIPLDAGNMYTDILPNSINTVGYRELLPYFRGEYDQDRAVELIQQNSRHYAKRQMTWWRKQGFDF